MRVLIIGGMGVIGGSITRAASKLNMEVYVVSRRALFGEWLDLGIRGIQGDWKDDAFAKKAVDKGYDVIVDTQVFNVNQLKRSMRIVEGYCKQYIYISTDSVYEHPSDNVFEDASIDMSKIRWKYGIDKRKAELFLIENEKRYSFFWTGIRPTITFGKTRIPVGYASKRNTYTLPERILNGKPIIRFDDPSTKHSICHSSIFGSAVVGLFLNEQAKSQFYHISDDCAYTYNEIFDVIERVLGKRGIYVYAPTRLVKRYSRSVYEEMIYDKNPEFTLDNSKIKVASPLANYHVELESVIENILEYLRDNSKGSDHEYDLVTDSVLLDYVNCIGDKSLKKKVEEYISEMPTEYRAELSSFKRRRIVDSLLYPLKTIKRDIKRKLIELKEKQ